MPLSSTSTFELYRVVEDAECVIDVLGVLIDSGDVRKASFTSLVLPVPKNTFEAWSILFETIMFNHIIRKNTLNATLNWFISEKHK